MEPDHTKKAKEERRKKETDGDLRASSFPKGSEKEAPPERAERKPRTRRRREVSPALQAIYKAINEIDNTPIGTCSERKNTLLKFIVLGRYYAHVATPEQIRDDLTALVNSKKNPTSFNASSTPQDERGPPVMDKYGPTPSLAETRALLTELLDYYLKVTSLPNIREDMTRFVYEGLLLKGPRFRQGRLPEDESAFENDVIRQETLMRFEMLLCRYRVLSTPEQCRDDLKTFLKPETASADSENRLPPHETPVSPAMDKYGTKPSVEDTRRLLREHLDYYLKTTPLPDIHEDVTRFLCGIPLVTVARFLEPEPKEIKSENESEQEDMRFAQLRLYY